MVAQREQGKKAFLFDFFFAVGLVDEKVVYKDFFLIQSSNS